MIIIIDHIFKIMIDIYCICIFILDECPAIHTRVNRNNFNLLDYDFCCGGLLNAALVVPSTSRSLVRRGVRAAVCSKRASGVQTPVGCPSKSASVNSAAHCPTTRRNEVWVCTAETRAPEIPVTSTRIAWVSPQKGSVIATRGAEKSASPWLKARRSHQLLGTMPTIRPMMVFHRSGAVPIPTELAPEISSCCATVHPSGNGHDHT